MTSTGLGSATATGTFPMHATFWPKKPIMGGLVQIKSDTHMAWVGGIPNSDWTSLKISTTDPSIPQLWFFANGAKVWMSSFQKKKDTCLVSNANYSGTIKILAWTLLHTSRIWKMPPRW